MLEHHSQSESVFLEKTDSVIRKVIQENSGTFLNQMILEHFNNPGKMVRPKMIYGLGAALDVSTQELIPWAASCEILHNATLIHDDLQDGDEFRRGQPTTWKKYGAAQAINAGDLLLLAAIQPITQQSELTLIFSKMACRIVNGQCLEFSLKDFSQLSLLEKKYFDCISAKTAALFAESARGVAVIAGLSTIVQNKLADIFDQLGIIFQVQDDILDLYGDKQRDVRGCDLKEGKISFLVVTHLKYNPEDVSVLKKILLKNRDLTTIEDIQEIESLFDKKETLKNSMLELNSMIKNVIDDQWLKNNPAVQIYVSQIINKILAPIEFIKL